MCGEQEEKEKGRKSGVGFLLCVQARRREIEQAREGGREGRILWGKRALQRKKEKGKQRQGCRARRDERFGQFLSPNDPKTRTKRMKRKQKKKPKKREFHIRRRTLNTWAFCRC